MDDTPGHMTPDEFRRRGRELIDFIAEYLESGAADGPVLSPAEPGEIASMLPEAPPESGESWDEILKDVDRVVMPGITHWQSPRFFGYFPASATYPAILGELLSAGLGVQGMLWRTSPACTEIETRVLDWLAAALGLPERFLSTGGAGGGVIQGTASEATLVAMIAARDRAGLRSADPATLTAYASSQAHSSIAKNARILGLPEENIRLAEVDDKLRMDPGSLRGAIAEDVGRGRRPFFICATLGTTSTGAVDPLREIGGIAREHSAWLHADAAWAGSALVCPENRWMIEGIELADSFNFNPHKWLLTNFDCSAFWVADRGAVLEALSIAPAYLRNAASDSGAVIDYRDWQVPLGRRFRALKLWFVMRHYGLEGLRAHIRGHIRLAEIFEELVRSDDRFELCGERALSLVCFRLTGSDDANERLCEAVNATGELFLITTRVPGPSGQQRTVLRFAVGSVRTTERDIRESWEVIGRTARELA